MSTRQDDGLDVAGALDAMAGTIQPSADAWSTNLALVRRRRHTTQAAALIGAVVIAGGTVGGLAVARDHGGSRSAAGSQPHGQRTGGGETAADLVGGPWAAAHYVRDGQPWIYYVGLGYERSDPTHQLGVQSATQRSDVPANVHMKWEQSVSLDKGYWPRPEHPVVPIEFTDSPGKQPYLVVGLTRPDVAELTVLVRDKNASTSTPPKRVKAQIHGNPRLKDRVFVAPYNLNSERIVGYTGRYSSGKPFTYGST